LLVAWERVKRNRGSRTAGVDGQTRRVVEQMGVDGVLAKLRQELKDGTYRPLPARERLIPKRSGKLRSLGISTVRDRIVQTAAKRVLEPIFEADFPEVIGDRRKRTRRVTFQSRTRQAGRHRRHQGQARLLGREGMTPLLPFGLRTGGEYANGGEIGCAECRPCPRVRARVKRARCRIGTVAGASQSARHRPVSGRVL
jgi:hypothetical protein